MSKGCEKREEKKKKDEWMGEEEGGESRDKAVERMGGTEGQIDSFLLTSTNLSLRLVEG